MGVIMYDWVDYRTLVALAYLLSTMAAQMNGSTKNALKRATSSNVHIESCLGEFSSTERYSFETNRKVLALISMHYVTSEAKAIIYMTNNDFVNAVKDLEVARQYLCTYKKHMLPRTQLYLFLTRIGHRFHLHMLLGTCCTMMGEFELGHRHFHVAKQDTNVEVALWARLLATSAKIAQYSIENSLEKHSLHLFQELDHVLHDDATKKFSNLRANVSFLRGILCVGNGALKDAEAHFKACSDMSEQISATQLQANAVLQQSIVQQKNGKNKMALDSALRSISLSESIGDILLAMFQQNQAVQLQHPSNDQEQANVAQIIAQAKTIKEFAVLYWLPESYKELLADD